MFQIHEEIKKQRVIKGLTEDEVAARLGIKRSTYQYWETKTPSVDKVKRVAQALGLPDDHFFVKQDVSDAADRKSPDKYIALMEERINDLKADKEYFKNLVATSLTGLAVGNKSVLAHVATILEKDNVRDAAGNKKRLEQLNEDTDRRIGENLRVLIQTDNGVASGK